MQRGFEHVLGLGFKTKLSSAGLVYKHYGKHVISSLLGIAVDHPDMVVIYSQVYKNFM